MVLRDLGKVAAMEERPADLLAVWQVLAIKCDNHTVFPVDPFDFINGAEEVNGRHSEEQITAGQTDKNRKNNNNKGRSISTEL